MDCTPHCRCRFSSSPQAICSNQVRSITILVQGFWFSIGTPAAQYFLSCPVFFARPYPKRSLSLPVWSTFEEHSVFEVAWSWGTLVLGSSEWPSLLPVQSFRLQNSKEILRAPPVAHMESKVPYSFQGSIQFATFGLIVPALIYRIFVLQIACGWNSWYVAISEIGGCFRHTAEHSVRDTSWRRAMVGRGNRHAARQSGQLSWARESVAPSTAVWNRLLCKASVWCAVVLSSQPPLNSSHLLIPCREMESALFDFANMCRRSKSLRVSAQRAVLPKELHQAVF